MTNRILIKKNPYSNGVVIMFYNKRIRMLSFLGLVAVFFVVLFLWQSKKSFDESILNTDNIYNHIEELSSATYMGRLAGSEGDEKALKYIENYFEEIGVEPAGVDDTYYQSFSTIIPDIDANPTFTISSEDGTVIKEFLMYEDYNVMTSMNGGGIDFSGDVILVGSDIYRIDPELIKDRIIIIEANSPNQEQVNYVIQNGGKGIICSADSSFNTKRKYESKKFLSIAGKTGELILVGYISREAYLDILSLLDDNNDENILSGINIKVKIGFPIIETSNILGKIEGKSSNGNVLLITTNIDGLGTGELGKYFPGAINNTSGIATLLEIANVLAHQKNLPYQTIVFAGWNGQQQQLSGSAYYLNNPIYPLKKTTVIHLGAIGEKTLDGLEISSDMINSTILKDKIRNYAVDAGLMINEAPQGYSVASQFADKLVPSVMLSDSNRPNTYEDTAQNIDKSYLENASMVLLNYIKRDIYKDVGFDYLNLFEIILIGIIALGGIISYMIVKCYNNWPKMKIMGYSIENIYFLTPVILLRKFFTTILPYFVAVFMLAILANLDPGTDIKVINDHITTDFSGYLTIKKSILYLRNMLNPSIHKAHTVGNIFEVIYSSSLLSILLISSSLIVSTIVGIFRGIYEGYKTKKAKVSSIGTLVLFSIPDVLIVLLGLLGYTFILKYFPLLKDVLPLNDFILPLLTLSVIPTIYISRITFITIQEELGKDYIKNAKAKGFSRKKILFYELMPAIVFKIVDTMPAIMTMLLSNMIIVEYLFNYHGIINYLLYFYKRQDVYRFVPLAVTLGLIYIIFTWGIQRLARLINPLKREVNK